MASTIPVTVVSGFLGAGKTTLLDAWLAGFAPGEVAVVVNEVSTTGLDGERLGERASRVVEITGGCICCSSFEALVAALEELACAAPARIVVETSGAASPAGVLRAVSRRDGLALDGVVTVVDASRLPRLVGSDLALEQLGYADVVVLTHADRVDERALEDAQSTVQARNGAAVIACAERGVLRDDETFEALIERRGRFARSSARLEGTLEQRAVVPATVHASPIESIALHIEGALDEDRFGAWMEEAVAPFAGRLFRIKGVLAIEGVDERVLVQGVGDGVEVTLGAPWETAPRQSRLVLVGFGLDRDALEATFAACAADQD